jgi:hypothetical protein
VRAQTDSETASHQVVEVARRPREARRCAGSAALRRFSRSFLARPACTR